MVANTINVVNETFYKKMIGASDEFKSLINGTYHVSIIDGIMFIHIGPKFRMHSNVIGRIFENRTVTYILEDNKKITFRV